MSLNNTQRKLILSDVVTVLLGLLLAWFTGEDGALDSFVLIGICVLLVISNIQNIIKHFTKST